MTKSSPESIGKGPVPVFLTGKVWTPSVQVPKVRANKNQIPGLAIGFVLLLTVIFVGLLSSTKPPLPVTEKPVSVTQRMQTGVASATVPEKTDLALVATTSAAIQSKPVEAVSAKVPENKVASVSLINVGPAETIARVETAKTVVSETPAVPIEPLPTAIPVEDEPVVTVAVTGSSTALTVASPQQASSGERFFSPTDIKTLNPKKPIPVEADQPKVLAQVPPKIDPIPAPVEVRSPPTTPAAVVAPVETPTPIPVEEPVSKPEPKLESESKGLPVSGKSADSVTDALPQDRLISGVPSLKKRSRILLGLRPVLQADGWEISWTGRQKGVTCRSESGNSLTIIPGKKRAILNGKSVYSPVRAVISKDGQLLVPVDFLNKILAGRLSVVKEGSSPGEVNVRLASAEKTTSPAVKAPPAGVSPSKELSGIVAVRRKGHVMVSLRQVLEADGWTVKWEGFEKGAICSKGDAQVFVVVPGKAKSRWNNKPIRNKRTPVLYNEKLMVAIGTLGKICQGRISLLSHDKKSRQAKISLVEG